MNGKGSKRRPQLVPNSQVEDNWAKTFGKKKDKKNGKQADVLPSDGSSDDESGSAGEDGV